MSTTMDASVELLEGMAFRGRTPSGSELTLDVPPEGEAAQGPKPIELLLVALGGCTAMDVISILRKMRQDVAGYRVNVRGERRDEHPRIYTHLEVEHVVRGRNVSVEAVRRAVELSATRYCAVSAMLGQTATIKERFRVVDDATGIETVGTLQAAA